MPRKVFSRWHLVREREREKEKEKERARGRTEADILKDRHTQRQIEIQLSVTEFKPAAVYVAIVSASKNHTIEMQMMASNRSPGIDLK